MGNEIVNAVINYHLSIPNSKEEVEVRGYLGSISEIEERDLCVIFSNLVQNAKEATQRLKEEEREILIEVKRGRNFIYGRIENTFSRKENQKGGHRFTTKRGKEDHGFGIDNVKQCVEKYVGIMEISICGNRYITQFRLPCKGENFQL